MIEVGAAPRMVIVGASVRSAAQCAARAGFKVFALDQFADRDLKAVAQVVTLQSILDIDQSVWEPWVGAPVLLCGGMENRPESIAILKSRGCICRTNPSTMSELRSPASWARWSSSSHLLFPQTHRDRDKDLPHDADDSWLIKSLVGAGGMSVRRWGGEPLHALEYVQRHIEGEVLGVTFLRHGCTSRVMGCAMSWPMDSFWGPMPFIYRGSIGPIPLNIEELARLTDFANRVSDETGLTGLWQADFVRNSDGWWLLEINPRWSSSMELIEAVGGVSLVAHHVAAVLDETELSSIAFDREGGAVPDPYGGAGYIGKVVRYASNDFVPSHELLEAWWEKRWDGAGDSLQGENRLADIPGETNAIPAGYPVCTEYASGGSIPEVRDRLQKSTIVLGRFRSK